MENISAEGLNNPPAEKKVKKKMTAQTRLIITGLVVSTVFIFCTACFATYGIDKNMNNAYKNFGQVLSKTLAIEGVEVTKEVPQLAKYDALRSNSISILRSNNDIAFIIFKDNDSKVIYSSKDDYPEQAEKARITVSSPMIVKNLGETVNVGSVTVGLSGTIMDKISATSKVSIALVFALIWLVIAGIVYMNSSIITGELRKLYQGVKKISSGEFGYMIDDKDVDKEVKELYGAFNDMSEKLSRYNEQTIESLTFERNKLESVLMSIVNGVVVCDNHDKVIMVNNHAKKLLEVGEEDIVGTQIQQFCDSSGEFCFNDKIAQFKDTPLEEDGAPVPFNITIDKRILKCLISPMFTRSNSYVGYIIVLIDVTKDVEMDELRSHFISNVSHELRTPVTVLRSYIDTLYNYGNDFDFNTQREFIGVMNQEIIRLNRMVNDILDFSRLDADVELEKTYNNIVSLVENCVNQIQILAQERNITLEISKDENIPEALFNYDSIERAVRNLLSNAIKYSPEGKKVRVNICNRPQNNITVTVQDEGCGISPEHQKKIFDRFYRVENDAHTIKGTGLGLHLVKTTIEKHHNGKVFVESNVGEGSTFGFTIPVNANILANK